LAASGKRPDIDTIAILELLLGALGCCFGEGRWTEAEGLMLLSTTHLSAKDGSIEDTILFETLVATGLNSIDAEDELFMRR
jgi:high-affinity nickel permease